jgi:hypothetical protein
VYTHCSRNFTTKTSSSSSSSSHHLDFVFLCRPSTTSSLISRESTSQTRVRGTFRTKFRVKHTTQHLRLFCFCFSFFPSICLNASPAQAAGFEDAALLALGILVPSLLLVMVVVLLICPSGEVCYCVVSLSFARFTLLLLLLVFDLFVYCAIYVLLLLLLLLFEHSSFSRMLLCCCQDGCRTLIFLESGK